MSVSADERRGGTTGLRPDVRLGLVTMSAQQAEIGVVVATYFVISISLVFVNKSLMTPGSSMNAPLFVTWFQCVVTVGIQYGLGLLARSAPKGGWLDRMAFPEYDFDPRVARKVARCAAVAAGAVGGCRACAPRGLSR